MLAQSKLIRKATRKATGASTVWVPIRAKRKGMRALRSKAKLAIRLKVTFTPTGGTARAGTRAAKLVKKP